MNEDQLKRQLVAAYAHLLRCHNSRLAHANDATRLLTDQNTLLRALDTDLAANPAPTLAFKLHLRTCARDIVRKCGEKQEWARRMDAELVEEADGSRDMLVRISRSMDGRGMLHRHGLEVLDREKQEEELRELVQTREGVAREGERIYGELVERLDALEV